MTLIVAERSTPAECESKDVDVEITHATRYCFSTPVFLEPHQLRFQPRSDGAQTLLGLELEIEPTPAGRSASLDASGNVTHYVWFDGEHDSLSIVVRSAVRLERDNPFDYLPDPTRSILPPHYETDAPALQPYLVRDLNSAGPVDEVAIFAARMRAAAHGELLPFLSALNNTMYERLTVVHREGGPAWAPMHTWREGRGACRDLAALYVDVCRAAGVAARFVSGYEAYLDSEADDPPELHAWAEVFVPGGGWRGYDPSRGLAVGQGHVAVAAAATPAGASPVIGTFRGSGARASIDAVIRIERRDATH